MSDDLLATQTAAPQTFDKLIGIDSLINSTTSNATTLSSVTDASRTGAEKFTDRSSLNSSSSSSASSIVNDAQLISLGSNANQNATNKNNSLDDDDLDDDYEQMQNSQNLFENRSLSNDNEFLLNDAVGGGENNHDDEQHLKISNQASNSSNSSDDMIKELFDFYDVEKSGYIQVDKFLEITKENMADQWEFNQKVNDPIHFYLNDLVFFLLLLLLFSSDIRK